MQGRRGVILIICYLVVALLLAFGSTLMVRSLNEQGVVQRHVALARAICLAEAGVDDALVRLRNPATGYWDACGNFGTAEYAVQCEKLDPLRRLMSTGTFTAPDGSATSRQVEVLVRRSIPPNFYDKAIYAADEITLKGNAYSVVGDILTGDEDPVQNTGNVVGTVTNDPAAQPLPLLDFAQLYAIAVSQGNVYDEARLDAIQQNQDAFPGAFCYSPPAIPGDPCVPNVNYITADLVLNGNIGTIGGFFVVVGNVLTDPTTTQDTTINGNGQIEGAIYTTGDFSVNGGGGGLNVLGGVWAGDEARLNGNATIQYQADYMNAIKHLGLNAGVQLVLWRDCSANSC
jgi:cytoskeletal protein CcmA (bactofilin family)